MKAAILILMLISLTFALDTLANKDLNFYIIFPKEPVKSVKENNDTYGNWTNTNYTAYESNTKRTTSLIIKDYTKYDQTGTSGAAIVTVTASMLLTALKAVDPFELTLTKGEHRVGYSFTDDNKQTRLHIYWAKSILYIIMIEEPHTVGVSMLDEFPASFKLLK